MQEGKKGKLYNSPWKSYEELRISYNIRAEKRGSVEKGYGGGNSQDGGKRKLISLRPKKEECLEKEEGGEGTM